jgi:hypothetical protein
MEKRKANTQERMKRCKAKKKNSNNNERGRIKIGGCQNGSCEVRDESSH